VNLQEHTLRVAILSVLRSQAMDAREAAGKEAQAAYKLARQAGISQLRPQIPGGGDAGTLSIKKGLTVVTFKDDALLEVVVQSTPEHVEDFIDPAALRDRKVLELLREHFPQYAGRRVTAARRADLEEEVKATGGQLLNLKTGAMVDVATVEVLPPTGEFAYTPGKPGTAAILAALKAGTITEDGRVAVPEPGKAEAG
jgi:hypothetical protein